MLHRKKEQKDCENYVAVNFVTCRYNVILLTGRRGLLLGVLTVAWRQEIAHILYNRNVYYCVHNSLPLVLPEPR